jgi:hypothetical protein
MLSTCFSTQIINTNQTGVEHLSRLSEDVITISESYEELGDTLLFDDFTTAPIGFNSSMWNLYTVNNPTMTWDDGEKQVFNSERFTHTTLVSVVTTGPDVICEFNISFTGGLSYFGVGWADEFQDPSDNYRSNLRESENGVFIDYWDGQLFLVSCGNSEEVATKISDFDMNAEHQYRLSWSESLVRLYINNIERGVISTHIPSVGLAFTITTCGHYYLADIDQLTVDCVGIYTRELSESDVYPRISLIWPSNNSNLFIFDEVDIDLDGENGESLYSWDGNTNSSFHSPWDIPVPLSLGLHTLDVFAHDAVGNWTSLHLIFTVIEYEDVLSVTESRTKPLIDGIVTREESQSFTKYVADLWGEDRSKTPFDLIIGYHNNSLYVGVLTSLHDQYYSRISLLIDGDGSGVWGDALQNSTEDIQVTAAAPIADESFNGIVTHSGQEVQPLGLVYDSAVTEYGVSAEFLIPIASVNGNSTIGLGLAIIVSQGGFDSYFPISYSADGTFIIVRNAGLRLGIPINVLVLAVALIAVLSVVTISTVFKPKETVTQIMSNLPDEELERIRTLIYSHPEISLDRLALLANTDEESVNAAVDILIQEDMLLPTIVVLKGVVTRIESASEKKQK